MNIVLVAADFNQEIVGSMIELAEVAINQQGGTVGGIVRVPGCYEMPFAVNQAIARQSTDAVVVLGYIERGETLHGEVMGHVVHGKLIDLQLQHGKPIGLGIIGPGATLEQARVRTKHTAHNAVRSVFALRS